MGRDRHKVRTLPPADGSGVLRENDAPTVAARRRDGPAPPSPNGFEAAALGKIRADKWILRGIEIATFGCAQATAHYQPTNLTFTVWVMVRPKQEPESDATIRAGWSQPPLSACWSTGD